MMATDRALVRAKSGRRLWPRIIAVAAIVIAAVMGMIAVALFFFARSTLPPTVQTVHSPHLMMPVTVIRDQQWVPHVYAETLPDAFFALGFVHAQDRMWQMESLRRFAAGRLAEIFGPRAITSDRWMRTMDLRRLVDAEFAKLSPVARTSLEAYVSGVNSWLARRSENLPPEFHLLRHQPEPWQAAHSLFWLKVMAMTLAGNRHEELLKMKLQRHLTADQLADIWPSLSEFPQPREQTAAAMEFRGAASVAEAIDAYIPSQRIGASNAWAVGGQHTTTGLPLLANDPHLSLTIPIQWYLAHVVTPDAEFAGATAPGFPFLILGQNRHVAWGVTGPEADVEDLVIEQLAGDGTEVLTADGTKPIEVATETIAVRGEADEILEIRRTQNGPIVSRLLDLNQDWVPDAKTLPGEKRPDTFAVSLTATYLQLGDRTAEAAFNTTTATSLQAFLSALDHFHTPLVNCIFADVEGNIGLKLTGRVPIRRNNNGFGPGNGAAGTMDWLGFVPAEQLPQSINPDPGWVVNANNRSIPVDFPWYVASGRDTGARADRITELLAHHKPQSLERMTAIQLDVVSPTAARLLPIMLTGLGENVADDPVTTGLRAWRGAMSATAWQPTFFAAWWRAFDEAVFSDELKDAFAEFQRPRPHLTEHVLRARQQWCDNTETDLLESCGDQLRRSFAVAKAALAERLGGAHTKWRWGRVHVARFINPVMDFIPLAGRLFHTALPTDGGWDTINRGAYVLADGAKPFTHVHGAGYRAVYDLSDPARSRFMIATGQSGNPLSQYYADLAPKWRNGEWVNLFKRKKEVNSSASATLTFLPQ